MKLLSDRRAFMQTATAAACTLAMPGVLKRAEAATPRELRIDAHTHFYDPRRPGGVPWPSKDDAVLYHPALPQDLWRVAPRLTGTVVVEASPWLEDNQWILDLAEKDQQIVAFVGHLTPGTPEFSGQLARFASRPLFRGIRIPGQSIAAGLERPDFVRDLQALAERGLALDVNGPPAMLADVPLLARKIPTLRVVINHAANLRIDGQTPPDQWLDGMRAAAEHANVFCKVSALVEGTRRPDGKVPVEVDFYRPVLDTLWKTWGDNRLIYASNWPVCERFAPYATVEQIVDVYLRSASPEAREKFFWRNSQAAYHWPMQPMR